MKKLSLYLKYLSSFISHLSSRKGLALSLSKGLALSKQSASNGFTLIELLVVIAVIGVLATIVLLAVNPAEQLKRARDTSRLAGATQLGRALQGYFTANGATFPASGTTWITTLVNSGDIKSVPFNPAYTTAPVAPICTYATLAQGGVVTGYCYAVTAGVDAIVYVKLESALYAGKCPSSSPIQAFWVFSTADARAGGVCRTAVQGEPVVGAQTFTF